ncbi:hypothetical protein ARMGADRAFT_631165 [Armillaria gallica]|uniref:F-box domain-containing protein n=1 Tax=Armillaria gallica TaxID=47427 RepID=A0A2H3DT49_ARMGA|nr:hypothetical protein ARMGADRAFT_631165 [Armillaria gallica]
MASIDPPATMMDLPDEILLIIVENLEEEDLITLGRLCRRLNRLALSRAIHLILNMERSVTIGTFTRRARTMQSRSALIVGKVLGGIEFPLLKAISLSLFKKPSCIQSIECTFSQQDFEHEASEVAFYFRTTPELIRIRLILNSGKGLFGEDFYNLESLLAKMSLQEDTTQPPVVVDTKERDDVSFRKLLRGLASLTAPDPVRGPSRQPRWVVFERDLIIGENTTIFQCQPFVVSGEVEILGTNVLFSTPFLDWTIASLNASHITKLTLHGLDDVGQHLSRIQMDHLQLLTVQSPLLSPSHLVPFLSRHNLLVRLLIDDIGAVEDANITFPSGSLPKVTHLNAPSDIILLALSKPSIAPLVTDVGLKYMDRPSVVDLQKLLRMVATHPHVCNLHIPFASLNQTREWLDYRGRRFESRLTHIKYLSVVVPEEDQVDQEVALRIAESAMRFPQVERISIHTRNEMTWMQAYIVKLAELKVIHSSPLSMVDVNHQHLKM